MLEKQSNVSPRFLVLVSKDMGELEKNRSVETAKAVLTAQLGLASAEVVDSSAWYRQEFSRCGDWDSWIWNTVTGKDYNTRKPHFTAFIVCEEQLGRANAQIIDLAVRNQRVVLFCQKDTPLKEVDGAEAEDPENWKAGWKVKLGRNIQ